MKKKLIIVFVIIIIALAGCFIYFKINNNKYLFKAYLEEHNGNYTLVIRNKDYFSFNEMWKVEDLTRTNGNFKMLPWALDSRIKKITKVDIQDNIKVDSLALWFYGFENLEEIKGLNKLDTSSLTNLSAAFYNCKSLKELDLSMLDTRKVILTDNMFANCENLTTIYVGDNWNMDKVQESTDMFKGCTNLVGPNETEYNEYIVDKTFAQVDDLDNAGYLTLKN